MRSTDLSVPMRNTYRGEIMYRGQKIAQWHNPRILMDDIRAENQTKQFTSILLVGTPGTGKTTLATFLAHEIHTHEDNFIVRHMGRKELLNLEKVIKALPHNKHLILIFDDVSNALKAATGEQKAMITQTITEARHPSFMQSADRRVVIISNVHYSNAHEKMLRGQGSWRIYTDMGTEEAEIFNHSTRNKHKSRVSAFMNATLSAFRRKEFTLSITANRKETYVTGGVKQDNPKSAKYGETGIFRIVMVFDNVRPRFFLIPNDSCRLCDDSNRSAKQEIKPEEISTLMTAYYGNYGSVGLKLAMLEQGQHNQYRRNAVYAKYMATQLLEDYRIDLDKLTAYMRKKAEIKTKLVSRPKIHSRQVARDLGYIREGKDLIEIIKAEKKRTKPKDDDDD